MSISLEELNQGVVQQPQSSTKGMQTPPISKGGVALSDLNQMLQVQAPEPQQEEIPQEEGFMTRNLVSGLQRSAAGMDWVAANAAMLAGDFFKKGYKGFPWTQLSDAADYFEKNYRRRTHELMKLAKGNADETVAAKAVQTLGGLPLSLLQAGAAASVGGPVAGFAGLGALGAADQDIEQVLKEATKGAFLGAVLKTTAGAPAVGRALAAGGTAAAISEGEDVDRAIEAATMATLSALPTGAGRRLEELKTRETEALVPEPALAMKEGAQPEELAMSPGENWSTFVAGTYEPVAVELGKGTKPIRRDEILSEFVKDMKQPIYQGRMGPRPKKTLGYFKPKTGELRIRNRNDLEVVSHEMAHAVETAHPEITEAYQRSPELTDELKSVSYNKDDPREGWAEFIRLWMTQPEKAHLNTPRAESFLDSFLRKNPDLETAFLKARKGMVSWFSQDALSRARSKIGPQQDLDDMFEGPWASWRQGIIDDTYGLERFEKTTTGGELMPAPQSPTKTARSMRAKYDIANGAIKYGIPKVQSNGAIRYEGEGLIDIFNKAQAKGGNLRDFIDSMIGRRARELKGREKEKLFTDDEIAAMLSLETPTYESAAGDYQKWNHGILNFAVDMGVLSRKAADAMQQYFYIPFLREGRARAGVRGFPVPGLTKATQRIRGGTSNIRDPIGTITETAARLIDISLSNEARLKVAELAKEPGSGRFLAKISKDSAPVRVLTEEAKKAFKQNLIESGRFEGEDPTRVDATVDQLWSDLGPMMTVWQHGLTPRGGNIMAVLKEGKPEFYEVLDPLLLRSILAFNRPHRSNPLMKLMMLPKQVVQYTVTRSLPFMGANIARDQIHAGIMGRHGYKPILDGIRGFHARLADIDSYYKAMEKGAPKAARERVEQDRLLYRDFVSNGGGMGGIYSPELIRALSSSGMRMRGLKPKGMMQRVLDQPRRLAHAFDEVSMAFELATRLGSYRRDVLAGMHPREAAYEARDLTDFARRGDYQALQFFLDTVPFFNAAIQGLDRFASGVARDPGSRAAVWRRIGYLATASGALAAMNYGNPLYENESDASKDFYWHFFVPSTEFIQQMTNGEVKETNSDLIKTINEGSILEASKAWDELQSRYVHYRYPKVWEIGSIATVAERAIEGILKNQPKQTAVNVTRAILANMRLNPTPAGLEPFLESLANKDFFTWQDITPERLKDIDPAFRYTPETPRVLRKAGEKTGISPVEMEHFIRSFFNTWGSAGLQLADWGFFGEKPDFSVDVNPATRRFVRGRSTAVKPKQDLYELHEELGELVATMNFLKKEMRFEDMQQYLAEHPEIPYYQVADRYTNVLQHTGTALSLVKNSTTLDEVQEIAKAWLPAARGRERLDMIRSTPTWKNTTMLKKWLVDEMRNQQNLISIKAMKTLEGVQP